MSADAAFLFAVLRSVLVAVGGASAGLAVAVVLGRLPGGSMRRLGWVLALSPLLIPPLIPGYVYGDLLLRLAHRPLAKEVVYVLLMTARLMPVAVLVGHFAAAPPVSPPAMHVARLSGMHWKVGILLRGPLRTALIAFVTVFLLAFSEFEIANLLNLRHSWTFWLFDAQHSSEPLLRGMVGPVLLQLTMLSVVLVLVWDQRSPAPDLSPRRLGSAFRVSVWTVLVLAVFFVVVVPLAVILHGAWGGLGSLVRDMFMAQRHSIRSGIVAGAVISAIAAATALGAGRVLFRRRAMAVVACGPGLLGPLVLALAVFEVFGWPVLVRLEETAVPMITALVLWLLPVSVVLALLADVRPESLHLARLLEQAGPAAVRRAGRGLRWRRHGGLLVWVGLGLFVLAFFEATICDILAPARLTPSATLAYNNMHFGRSQALSAMVLLNFAAVLSVVLLVRYGAGLVGRFWPLGYTCPDGDHADD